MLLFTSRVVIMNVQAQCCARLQSAKVVHADDDDLKAVMHREADYYHRLAIIATACTSTPHSLLMDNVFVVMLTPKHHCALHAAIFSTKLNILQLLERGLVAYKAAPLHSCMCIAAIANVHT